MEFKVQNILVPVDFSDCSMVALEHAALMSKQFKANLFLIHVMETSWTDFTIVVPEVIIDTPNEMADKIEQKLRNLAEEFEHTYHLRPIVINTSGNIRKEIIEIANENEIDIIVMGTHGISGYEESFLGHNTYKVITLSKVPVMAIQADVKIIGFKKILIPLDNTFNSTQKVPYALELAKYYNAEVYAVGLTDFEGGKPKLDVKLAKVQTDFEKANIPFNRSTLTGRNYATLTLDYADEIGADLILIMTEQDKDFTGMFLGPFSQQIVSHAKIPVMTIRPKRSVE